MIQFKLRGCFCLLRVVLSGTTLKVVTQTVWTTPRKTGICDEICLVWMLWLSWTEVPLVIMFAASRPLSQTRILNSTGSPLTGLRPVVRRSLRLIVVLWMKLLWGPDFGEFIFLASRIASHVCQSKICGTSGRAKDTYAWQTRLPPDAVTTKWRNGLPPAEQGQRREGAQKVCYASRHDTSDLLQVYSTNVTKTAVRTSNLTT